MLWRDVLKNSVFARFFAFVLLALFVAMQLSAPALAVDTEIGAKVCGSNPSGALIDITQPNNDSIVNQSVTTFRGTVASSSQIIVELNGSYNSTIALATNQTDFATDIALPEGTHTVTMRATEVCGGADGVDSIVLTYTPLVEQPSDGATTPTEVEEIGVVSQNATIGEAVSENDFVRQIEQLPVIGAAVSVVADFASAIGLESTVISGNAPAVAGLARVGVTVAALTSVVMASALAPISVQVVPGLSEVFTANSHRSMMYLGWVIRGVGVLAMAFAYLL